MAEIIRDYADSFKSTDFTAAINEEENQFGFLNGQGLFETTGTTEKAIVFDKNTSKITLIPQVNRGSHTQTTGHERAVETFSLPLAYFNHIDTLTAEDILGWRAPGSTDKETVARAAGEKTTDMRYMADQMDEYMKCQAIKGIFKTPDQVVMANMFTEFGISQQALDLDLDVGATDVNAKIAELKRKVKAGLKSSTMTGVDVYLDEEGFDRLVSHSSIKAYYDMSGANSARFRDETAQYTQWGVMDSFEHKGVRFFCYNPTFNLPTGSTEDFLSANTGIAMPRGARGLFRGYNGPTNKLSQLGAPGQARYLRTYLDPRDNFVEFELEMAPLYFCTQPASLVAITA